MTRMGRTAFSQGLVEVNRLSLGPGVRGQSTLQPGLSVTRLPCQRNSEGSTGSGHTFGHVHFPKKPTCQDFPDGPAKAGDTGSTPGPGRSHVLWGN